MLGDSQAGPCVLSLVERKSGYLLLGQLRQRTSAAVNERARQLIAAQPHPVRTITVDNGTEFHEYAALEQTTGAEFYFATPHHAWERGTNGKHERPRPAVSPQAPEHGPPHSTRLQSDRCETEPPTAEATWLPHSGGMLCEMTLSVALQSSYQTATFPRSGLHDVRGPRSVTRRKMRIANGRAAPTMAGASWFPKRNESMARRGNATRHESQEGGC